MSTFGGSILHSAMFWNNTQVSQGQYFCFLSLKMIAFSGEVIQNYSSCLSDSSPEVYSWPLLHALLLQGIFSREKKKLIITKGAKF